MGKELPTKGRRAMGRFLPTPRRPRPWRPNCAGHYAMKMHARAMHNEINALGRNIQICGRAPGKNSRPGLPSAPAFAGREG
jgi:hypothetical protein